MSELSELVRRALAEDVGDGDLTSAAVVDAGARARARLVQKQPGIVFGLPAAEEVFRQAGVDSFQAFGGEGGWHDAVPRDVAVVIGPARAILAGERTALNLLGHLSGVATLTARFVEALGGGARLLDTRKTMPGMRALEKAAVAAGGGHNHRMGLHDAILIKENHATLAGGVGEAVRRALLAQPDREVEVECRSLEDLGEALEAGARRILLDNMDAETLRAASALAGKLAGPDGRPVLEASGGITLENAAAVAATGVDFVSVGAVTHSAPALDLSLLVEPV